MAFIYTVKQGDSMASIAKANGFRDYRTIYGDAANAPFRALRPNPDLLFPGDRLTIPDKQPKTEEANTGQRTTFFVGGSRPTLRILLKDARGKPLRSTVYELIVGTDHIQGSTDGTGLLHEEIPIDAKTATLKIKGYAWTLGIADLNPMPNAPDGGISGAKGRLRNLGYDVASLDGTLDDKTRAALRSFQQRHDIRPADGELSAATEAALAAAHGC